MKKIIITLGLLISLTSAFAQTNRKLDTIHYYKDYSELYVKHIEPTNNRFTRRTSKYVFLDEIWEQESCYEFIKYADNTGDKPSMQIYKYTKGTNIAYVMNFYNYQ